MRTKLTRRTFAAAAGAAVAPAQGFAVFTAIEARFVDAITGRIIPRDQDPGAQEAGVVHYIDRQLAGPLKRFRALYTAGLREIQAQCPHFLELPPAEQDEFLHTIEQQPFFQALIDHTMQGFYGHPQHGGNRDQASWKMLRIDSHMGDGPHGGRTHEVA